MTIIEAVIARLKAIPAVTALVGTRIYQMKLPQNPTFPAIRVQRISEVEPLQLRGSSGVRRTRVQIDSISAEGGGVDPAYVANEVDEAVQGLGDGSGLTGFMGTVGSPGLRIRCMEPVNVTDTYDPDELRQFRVMRDYLVTWSL